jgi:hypothetical protein
MHHHQQQQQQQLGSLLLLLLLQCWRVDHVALLHAVLLAAVAVAS